jgi:dTDP-4-amino-4,6-dideoxygalactose transaminase
MTNQMIPFIDLQTQQSLIKEKLDARWQDVLRHGQYVMGPEVLELETQLKTFSQVSDVISCASGTDALYMALMAYNIKPGDAVFVPSFTFAATAEVVALIGAIPVFVDVQEDTFNMDPESLEDAILATKARGDLSPKAVIAVDLFGQPADHAEIFALAEKYGIKMIVDAAQSAGALYQGKPTLRYGHVATTSFFPAKPLGCYGDGGAIFTNDGDLANILRSIRVHGQGTTRYQNDRLGITGRLDTLQAAILLEKLAIFPDEIKKRQNVADFYSGSLSNAVKTPIVKNDRTSVWAQYTIQVENRDTLQKTLSAQGIPTMIYYPEPLHIQKPYRDFLKAPKGLPITEKLAASVLSLPMHAYVTKEHREVIVEGIKNICCK